VALSAARMKEWGCRNTIRTAVGTDPTKCAPRHVSDQVTICAKFVWSTHERRSAVLPEIRRRKDWLGPIAISSFALDVRTATRNTRYLCPLHIVRAAGPSAHLGHKVSHARYANSPIPQGSSKGRGGHW
jgi:hypothetical protein